MPAEKGNTMRSIYIPYRNKYLAGQTVFKRVTERRYKKYIEDGMPAYYGPVVYRIKMIKATASLAVKMLPVLCLFFLSHVPAEAVYHGSAVASTQRYNPLTLGVIDITRVRVPAVFNARHAAVAYSSLKIEQAFDEYHRAIRQSSVVEKVESEVRQQEVLAQRWDDLRRATGLAVLLYGGALLLVRYEFKKRNSESRLT